MPRLSAIETLFLLLLAAVSVSALKCYEGTSRSNYRGDFKRSVSCSNGGNYCVNVMGKTGDQKAIFKSCDGGFLAAQCSSSACTNGNTINLNSFGGNSPNVTLSIRDATICCCNSDNCNSASTQSVVLALAGSLLGPLFLRRLVGN